MKRCIAILTIGAFLQACMHWGTKPLEPKRFNGANPDRQVRVTLTDGEILIVKCFVIVVLGNVPNGLPRGPCTVRPGVVSTVPRSSLKWT